MINMFFFYFHELLKLQYNKSATDPLLESLVINK